MTSLRAMVVGLLAVAPVMAQGERPDVGWALDQRIEQLAIQGAEVPEALRQIGEAANVSISIDESSLELLPWGPKTQISAMELSGVTLRAALPQILGPIGMDFRIGDKELLVFASQPLKRMIRRATWADLALLRSVREMSNTPENFEALRFRYKITSKVDAPALLREELAKSSGLSMAEALEVATSALGWVWFPDGEVIYIRTNEAQFANQLARRTTVRYANESLSHILLDLAKRANIALNLEPGMMRRLPAGVAENYTLFLRDESIRQALEVIKAETGLVYEMQRDGLHMSFSGEDTGAQAASGTGAANGTDSSGAARAASAYVGKLTIPMDDGSYSFEILIRADDLPSDVLEYRQQLIEQAIQKMRAEMAPKGEE